MKEMILTSNNNLRNNQNEQIQNYDEDKKKNIEKIKEVFDSIVIDLASNKLFSGLVLNWGLDTKGTLGNELKKGSRFVEDKGKNESQYSNVVFWYRLNIITGNDIDSFIPIKKSCYDGVLGIHIMPYCITEKDIGVSVRSNTKTPFNTQENYVDLDTTAFNFHKHFDKEQVRFQVVFVNNNSGQYGPGKNGYVEDNRLVWGNLDLKEKMKYVKKNWYFPPIKGGVETCDISDCLADLRSEELLEKKPIKRLEYLLAVDIVKAMQTVLTENSFQEYLAKIDLNALCELELETNAYFQKLDAKRKALTK